MKAGSLLLSAILLLPGMLHATTLRLSSDIDLLVLDGKKVSSTLLRGADSIELDNGPHQMVFRVDKSLPQSSNYLHYISPPIIVSFDTRLISQVNINLPPLDSPEQTRKFDVFPEITLVDGNALPIPLRLDILTTNATPSGIDYEQAAAAYNQTSKTASPTKPSLPLPDDSALLSKKSELDFPVAQAQNLTEQRLKYWFLQADPETRRRFLQWAHQQPSS